MLRLVQFCDGGGKILRDGVSARRAEEDLSPALLDEREAEILERAALTVMSELPVPSTPQEDFRNAEVFHRMSEWLREELEQRLSGPNRGTSSAEMVVSRSHTLGTTNADQPAKEQPALDHNDLPPWLGSPQTGGAPPLGSGPPPSPSASIVRSTPIGGATNMNDSFLVFHENHQRRKKKRKYSRRKSWHKPLHTPSPSDTICNGRELPLLSNLLMPTAREWSSTSRTGTRPGGEDKNVGQYLHPEDEVESAVSAFDARRRFRVTGSTRILELGCGLAQPSIALAFHAAGDFGERDVGERRRAWIKQSVEEVCSREDLSSGVESVLAKVVADARELEANEDLGYLTAQNVGGDESRGGKRVFPTSGRGASPPGARPANGGHEAAPTPIIPMEGVVEDDTVDTTTTTGPPPPLFERIPVATHPEIPAGIRYLKTLNQTTIDGKLQDVAPLTGPPSLQRALTQTISPASRGLPCFTDIRGEEAGDVPRFIATDIPDQLRLAALNAETNLFAKGVVLGKNHVGTTNGPGVEGAPVEEHQAEQQQLDRFVAVRPLEWGNAAHAQLRTHCFFQTFFQHRNFCMNKVMIVAREGRERTGL